ncbi:MAG TPA: hypothetical protein VHE83_06395 [Mycobacteriales bacterium]|nr:hypothetical protein [Mycobacteriales bacterium]
MDARRWARALVAVAAAGLLSAFAAPAAADDGAANAAVPAVAGTYQGLAFEGRAYDLFVPDTPPRAFVLALHNYQHTPQTLEATSGIFALAARHAWVVAVPAGIGRSWNAGFCCGSAAAQGFDDEHRLAELEEHVTGALGISDLPRFALGLSNGGMMAARMSCDGIGRFTGVVLVSANLQVDDCPAFTSQVLVVRGGRDRSVPIAGARYSAYLATHLHSDGYLLGTWRRLVGGCRNTATASRAVLQDVLRCRGGAYLRYVEDRRGGHVWFAHRRHDAVDTNTLLRTFIDEHAPAPTGQPSAAA